MPQLPTTTVVTPCESLGSMPGVRMTLVSSCVCTSMKPGASASRRRPRAAPGRRQLADGRDASAFQRHAGAVFGLAAAVQHAHVAYESVKHLLFQVQSPSGSRFEPPR